MADKKHLEDLAQFIRDHRSNEQYFKLLYDKLLMEYESEKGNTNPAGTNYKANLHQALEKHATAYKENKEKDISTWSEFENFVSHFEKSVTEAMNG